jgi:hypothetical protein
MRLPRFQTWITALVDANLPTGVKRITSFLRYTLAPGERRSESTEWRIQDAV